ncbi:Putative AC transposase [Linum perenne]
MKLNLQAETGLGSTAWTYCEKRLRMKITKMIIKEEFPFNFVEREGFQDVIAEASPYFKMLCRKSIRAACLRLFIDGKEELKLLLNQKCDGRVSITIDCWIFIQNFNYICITAHFVGVDWKLHKKIINFRCIFSHKGVDIDHIFVTCLKEWNLTNLISVTVDNASANDAVIQCLKDKQNNVWGTGMLEGKYMHMRCITHITNLIVSHGLSHMGMSIRRVREAIRYVRSSPARAARFKDCAVFKRIPCTKLVSMDVATRWNSTYLMLASAEPYEVAFKYLEADDPQFVYELGGKVHGDEVIGHPTQEDWVNVRNLLPFLGAFHDLTLVCFRNQVCYCSLVL